MAHRDGPETFLDGTLNRRRLLAFAPAATLAGAALPRLVKPAAAQPASFAEAPALAEQVAAGQLPPVEERLPSEPLVVEPNNVVGTYGGTLRGGALAPETTSDLQVGMVTGLFRFSNDVSEIYPEVATGYEFSEDYQACTITLREGVKWSDGEPLTADDILFFFDDYQLDPDVSPVVASQWQPGGEPMKIVKVDDYTLRFEFAVPNPSFALVHYSGAPAEPWRPRHYAEKFHAKYNPNADQEAQEAGFEVWQARFTNVADALHYGVQDIDMPVLAPWRPVANSSQRQEYERNPYYFKVDTEGNQLPYIDQVVIEYATDLNVLSLQAVSGAFSVAGMDLLLVNYPVIKEGEEAGDYQVRLVFSERGADVALALNQNHPNPQLNELFGDVRFRQALSLGINREEINELVFLGQGTPRQATINETASFFKEEWALAYADFDPDEANRLLDELGLDQRGSDGVRLLPDGTPLTFLLEYLPHEGPKKEVSELVVKHWADLGVDVDAAARERNFLITRINAGEHDASAWHVDRQLERPAYAYGTRSSKLGPGGDSAITYAKAWRDWFESNGETGVEPPEDAQALHAAFNRWGETAMDTPEYNEAAIEVHDLVAESLYVIGVVGQGPQPLIVANTLENVFSDQNPDERIWWGAANWFWHPHRPEQWFFTA